jgi:hypothetical protein
VKATAANLQTQLDQIDDSLTAGDIPGAQDKLLTVARSSATGTQQNEINGLATTLQALDDIEYALNEWQQAGQSTNFFVGTEEAIRNKIGKTKDPALAAIATKILATMQSYRLKVTGKAFTQQETQEYKKVFPDIGKEMDFNTVNRYMMVSASMTESSTIKMTLVPQLISLMRNLMR